MKRRAWWFVLILLIVIPTGMTLKALRREQTSRNLIQAIKSHNSPAALAAFQSGADPNARDRPMDKPLSFSDQMTSLLDHLLHPHPDTHPTALQLLFDVRYSDQGDDLTLAKALLDAGADPNYVDTDKGGDSPLMLTANWGCSQSCHLLLSHGADVRAKDDEGRTALHWAALSGANKIIDSLLAAGADIRAKDNSGRTALHWACMDPDNATVQALLHHYANAKARDNEGDTPLHSAMRYGDSNLIDNLLAAGADIDARNKSGWTPLHMASSYRNIDAVKALLRHHADIYARTTDGYTALETTQNVDAIQVLRHAGGKTGAELDAGREAVMRGEMEQGEYVFGHPLPVSGRGRGVRSPGKGEGGVVGGEAHLGGDMALFGGTYRDAGFEGVEIISSRRRPFQNLRLLRRILYSFHK